MSRLDPGYACEVDKVDCNRWHELMLQFDDASFYQTWAFGAVHSGDTRLSHLVLKSNGTIVGMAQARIARVLGLPVGIAYVGNGPMWKRKGAQIDVGHLRNMLRALHHEFVMTRRYFLRVVPNLVDCEESASLKAVFEQEGFGRKEDRAETVVLDLSLPLDHIRRNLGMGWRRSLHAGEKKGLIIIEGTDQRFCGMALDIFHEMKERKRFFGGDQREALEVQKRLPEDLKLHFLVCTHAAEPVAVLGFVTFGATGLPVVGATSAMALELSASHVLWWKMIEYYKHRGFSAVDLAGVNERKNPGGFYFKTRILGKTFTAPTRKLGQFDACRNPLSESLFRTIHAMRDRYRETGHRLARSKTPVPTQNDGQATF